MRRAKRRRWCEAKRSEGGGGVCRGVFWDGGDGDKARRLWKLAVVVWEWEWEARRSKRGAGTMRGEAVVVE